MNTAMMKKIIQYRGNQAASRVAIIKEKAAWALGKLGSRISPGHLESFESISKNKNGL
jgi:hypothetical protein